MKRTLFAGAIALTVVSPAFAADLPAGPPPQAPAAYVPVQAPVYNWGGVYIGVNAGGSWITQASPTFNLFGSGLCRHRSGVQRQWLRRRRPDRRQFPDDQFVFGVEADADYLSNKARCTAPTRGLGASQHVLIHFSDFPFDRARPPRLCLGSDAALRDRWLGHGRLPSSAHSDWRWILPPPDTSRT